MSATTVTNTPLKDSLLAHFPAFEASLGQQKSTPWHTKRQHALSVAQGLDVPTTRHEEWKYTSLRALQAKTFGIGTPSSITQNELSAYLPKTDHAARLMFVNGKFNASLSTIHNTSWLATDLAHAYDTHSSLIDTHLGSVVAVDTHLFTALNAAFSLHGAFIHVPKNTVVEKSIEVIYLSDARQGSVLAHPRSLVIVGENAQAIIVEHSVVMGENPVLSNTVTEVVCGANSHLDHYKLQVQHQQGYHIGYSKAVQAKGSVYRNTTITLDGALTRNNLHISLEGERTEGHMHGLFVMNGTDLVDNHTVVDHRMPNAFSNELYKGVLDGKSTGVFNGKIFVQQDAQKTNAFQSNKNILLSEKATMNTKPQLEIWADDVKCSHGATTGALDEEPMFYLRSRGIRETEARALLLQSFAQDVVDHIRPADLRDWVTEKITERLIGNVNA